MHQLFGARNQTPIESLKRRDTWFLGARHDGAGARASILFRSGCRPVPSHCPHVLCAVIIEARAADTALDAHLVPV